MTLYIAWSADNIGNSVTTEVKLTRAQAEKALAAAKRNILRDNKRELDTEMCTLHEKSFYNIMMHNNDYYYGGINETEI